jgi:hypothetical protein
MLGRMWLGLLVTPVAALALLVTAPAAVAAETTLTASNCMAYNVPGGYSFLLTGMGFPSATPLVVRWADTFYPDYRQFVPVTTLVDGTFTTPLAGGLSQNYPVYVRVFDLAGNVLAETTVTCSSPSPTPGCVAVGHAHAAGNFKMGPGSKDDVHVEADGDCDYDKKTGMIFLHHAKVLVRNGPGPAVIDAKSDDVIGVAIVDSSDAVITGTYKGQQFTVTLHDGGKGHSNDSVDVVYGTTVIVSSATAPHGNVHIDDH